MKFAWSFVAPLVLVSSAAVSVVADNERILQKNIRDKSGIERDLDENIVGGENVTTQEFPFFVSGGVLAPGQSIAGSLILPDVVLSNAFISGRMQNISRVLVGSYLFGNETPGSQWRNVIGSPIVHPNYNITTGKNNLMLFRIEQVTSPTLKPINLNTDPGEPMDNEKLAIMGHGDTVQQLPNTPRPPKYSEVLQKVALKFVDWPRCVSIYNSDPKYENFFSVGEKGYVCAIGAANKGDCYGDGGSPLIRMVSTSPPVYEQVGVDGWGPGCAINGYPTIHNNVADLYDWITTTANSISGFSFPTPSPTKVPTRSPTNRPTSVPTLAPTRRPTTAPTAKTCYAKGETCNLTPKLPCCTSTPALVCLGTTKKCGACVKKGKKCKAKGDCCKKVCVKGVCTK